MPALHDDLHLADGVPAVRGDRREDVRGVLIFRLYLLDWRDGQEGERRGADGERESLGGVRRRVGRDEVEREIAGGQWERGRLRRRQMQRRALRDGHEDGGHGGQSGLLIIRRGYELEWAMR